jgi:hypothetical protein
VSSLPCCTASCAYRYFFQLQPGGPCWASAGAAKSSAAAITPMLVPCRPNHSSSPPLVGPLNEAAADIAPNLSVLLDIERLARGAQGRYFRQGRWTPSLVGTDSVVARAAELNIRCLHGPVACRFYPPLISGKTGNGRGNSEHRVSLWTVSGGRSKKMRWPQLPFGGSGRVTR